MYDYEEEYDEEEYEKSEAENMSEVKESENGKIKLEMDTENIVYSIVTNVKRELKQEIMETLKREMLEKFTGAIEKEVIETTKNILKETFETQTIEIGGGWNKESKTMTYKEYAISLIAENIETGKYNESRYKDKSFMEYFKENVIDSHIKN